MVCEFVKMVRIGWFSDITRTTPTNTRDCFGSRKLRTLFDTWKILTTAKMVFESTTQLLQQAKTIFDIVRV